MEYRIYPVSRKGKEPLHEFILAALKECGCRVLFASEPDRAPFRITFETDIGERLGISA